MNILFLRPLAETGGVSRLMHTLAQELEGRGHVVSLAASGGEWVARFERVHRLPLYPSTPYHLIVAAWQLARLIREKQIDILHSHHRFTTIMGKIASAATGVPLVSWVHEFKHNHRWLGGLWLAPDICTGSQALAKHLMQFNAVGEARLTVIRVGVEPFEATPEAMRTLRQLTGGAPTIGFAGRLSKEKGVDVLLRAVPKVQSALPQVRVMIIGDGPQRDPLRRLARQLEIEERVIFTGERDDAPMLIAALDIVVAPSYTDNFSLTVAEAMASGRVVVASAVGGLPEMVDDGTTGLLFAAGDVDSLASRLTALLTDGERTAAMGQAARRKALAWQPARAAQLTESVYRRAIDHAKR